MLFDRLRLMAARVRLHRLFSLISGESSTIKQLILLSSPRTTLGWNPFTLHPVTGSRPRQPPAVVGPLIAVSPQAASAEETNRNHPPPGPFGRSG